MEHKVVLVTLVCLEQAQVATPAAVVSRARTACPAILDTPALEPQVTLVPLAPQVLQVIQVLVHLAIPACLAQLVAPEHQVTAV